MAHSFADRHSTHDNSWMINRASLAELFAFTDADDGSTYRYLLVLRFILLNSVGLFLLLLVWQQGWIDGMFDGESTELLALIIGVFAFGLVACGQKIVVLSRELNLLSKGHRHVGADHQSRVQSYFGDIQGLDGQSRANIAQALRLKLANRIGTIRHIANSLVILGLIGTVIGFMIALSGVNPDVVSDISAVGPMVSTLISGMSVALYTTLVGAVLNVWLMINYRLLEGGTVNLFTKLVEAGERYARV